MNAKDCIFCKIIAGQIPAATVYEDQALLAFLDIGPVSDGHTLIIPKTHYPTVDQCPPEVLTSLVQLIRRIAKAVVAATRCDGYNVLCNNGRAAGQLVHHVHFHVIPRVTGDGVFNHWPSSKYLDGKMEVMMSAIRKNLSFTSEGA
jgi:histidine triad (HIT) family protein